MKIPTVALLIMLLFIAPGLADRSLGDSSIELVSPSGVDPGTVVDFDFQVTNGSPDGEMIRRFEVTFPSVCFTITEAWFDEGATPPWDFAFTLSSEYGGYFSIRQSGLLPGQSGVFHVRVSVDGGCHGGEQSVQAAGRVEPSTCSRSSCRSSSRAARRSRC